MSDPAPPTPPAAPALYPTELVRDVALRNGTRLHVRPIRADDEERLSAFYDRLSRHTAYQRFFSTMRRLPPDWARLLANVDYVRRLALVATVDPGPAADVVAVARYEPTSDPATAEVAFVVVDGWQNQGLGTILFRLLMDAARARGIVRFRAWVLADNRRMLDLIADLGHVRERTLEQGVMELVFTDDARERRPAV
jgi:RimJ/RimL family protein N-acetyltransferase